MLLLAVAATARAGKQGRVEQGFGGRPGGRGDADVAVQARGQHRAVVEQLDLAGQLVRVGCPGRGGQVTQEARSQRRYARGTSWAALPGGASALARLNAQP